MSWDNMFYPACMDLLRTVTLALADPGSDLPEWFRTAALGRDMTPLAQVVVDAVGRAQSCLCTVGAQECPVHPGRPYSIDQRFAFERAWDARFKAVQR